MADQLQTRILSHLKSDEYRPQKARTLAKELDLAGDQEYHAFRDALKELMHAGRVVYGSGGTIVLPGQATNRDEFVGTFRQNKRGFGFVIPTDPSSREDLFIPEGENAGAMTGDVVKAKITNREHREGKVMYRGRITEILQRSLNKFVGTLARQGKDWVVLPDGNTLTEPIFCPDAASRHVKPGTKVVVELTQYPERGLPPVGVITDVLGKAGEKDVDLKSVIIQFNLPGPFPDEVKEEARHALDRFDPESEREHRVDISDQVIVTIDPPDAKDYDDAISLRRLDSGDWELGVHIADVAHFVPAGSALDTEAQERGNSCYFPGHVIPMLPEILSNGVCSLQEGVPRLCKSAFITYDEGAKPVGTKFANTVIKSRKRLRYIEAQAIIDAVKPRQGGHGGQPPHHGQAESGDAPPAQRHYVPLEGTKLVYDPAAVIPHPEGNRRVADYTPEVVELVHQMYVLSKRLQKRRLAQGQLVLDLPEVELVLDEEGKVVDAVPEDQSFTHTLIEMFMVEANEAVARLFDSLDVPYLRRAHPEPEFDSSERLRQFVHVAGLKLPKDMDRKAIQQLLQSVKGKPEAFAINLAVLKSLTRAEYSPEPVGHYALASEAYAHFTSPIRRYADLTVHRLLDQYLRLRADAGAAGGGGRKRKKVQMEDVPTFDELQELGRHISFTERRAEDAERELRKVKLLELLGTKLGEDYLGVITGITNFGIFVQLQTYLIDGLIRYEDLMDDWWDVDVAGGFIRGQRTGKRMGIGDVVKARVVRVDPARRELDLAVTQILGRRGATPPPDEAGGAQQDNGRGGGPPRKKGKPKAGKKGKSEKHAPPQNSRGQGGRGGGGGGQRPPGGNDRGGGSMRNRPSRRGRRR